MVNTSNTTALAHNIRFLRKSQKMSQQDLADALAIKRSNIAAYESKNVEPRLRIILELAKLFNVSVKDLIDTPIDTTGSYAPFEMNDSPSESSNIDLSQLADTDIQNFIEKSIKIRKVLEGFKAFYNFKKSNLQNVSDKKDKLIFDIDNFLQLMDHLLVYNESVITAINLKPSSVQR